MSTVNTPWLTRHRTELVAAAALVPLLVAGLLATIRSDISTATGVLVMVLVVVAASSTGYRLAGFVAAVSSGVWFDFFLIQPYGNFAVTDPNDLETVVLLLLVGGAVTELALWGLRQQAQSSRRSGYLDGVLRTAESVAERQPVPADLIEVVAAQITEVLRLDRCHYVPDGRASGTLIEPDGSVTRQGHPLDVERDGLPTDDEIALPVRSGGELRGAYLLTAATHVVRPSKEQLRVTVLLADQVGGVLARHTPR